VKHRDVISNMVLVLCSILFAYAVMEVGFRYYLYRSTYAHIFDALYRMTRNPPNKWVEFNAHTGFRYRPNGNFVGWRSNEYGMVANDRDTSQYPVEKLTTEFRIAALGDSFTAGIHSKTRWPDLLQDALNESPEWRVPGIACPDGWKIFRFETAPYGIENRRCGIDGS
jgi:hypothetical protein